MILFHAYTHDVDEDVGEDRFTETELYAGSLSECKQRARQKGWKEIEINRIFISKMNKEAVVGLLNRWAVGEVEQVWKSAELIKAEEESAAFWAKQKAAGMNVEVV